MVLDGAMFASWALRLPTNIANGEVRRLNFEDTRIRTPWMARELSVGILE
jgi:hypothetical protein